MMTYYPDQRYVSALTVIRRRCLLPENAVGSVRVRERARVDLHDIVANGIVPAQYYILDAAAFFKLRKVAALDDLLFVDVDQVVQEEDVLAGKNPDKGKRLLSPVRGVVVAIENGRIILQATPEIIDIEAGVRGRVVRVMSSRGVEVETIGARVQGVWGNNHNLISTMVVAPEDNLEDLPDETIGTRYGGSTLLTRNPLTAKGLLTIQQKELGGVIAPSMDTRLIEPALKLKAAILLTEGFGNMRMSRNVFTLLEEYNGHQVTIDAHKPDRWEIRAPEVIINVQPPEGEIPARPNVMLSLKEGMTVRVTREPFAGLSGVVVYLPKSPVLLENGLRIRCAQVELIIGETVFVPLTNLEVLGR
jgi:hypothetical protein